MTFFPTEYVSEVTLEPIFRGMGSATAEPGV